MIFTTDTRGSITYICADWAAYAGQSRADACRDGWTAPVLAADREFIDALLADAARVRAEFTVGFRVQCADGSIRWLAAGGVPSFGPPGRIFLGRLGSMTEFAPTEAPEIGPYGGIERFVPPPTRPATRPVSPLDTIADHLIIVHSLKERHDATAGPRGVKAALFNVGVALSKADGSRSRLN